MLYAFLHTVPTVAAYSREIESQCVFFIFPAVRREANTHCVHEQVIRVNYLS